MAKHKIGIIKKMRFLYITERLKAEGVVTTSDISKFMGAPIANVQRDLLDYYDAALDKGVVLTTKPLSSSLYLEGGDGEELPFQSENATAVLELYSRMLDEARRIN